LTNCQLEPELAEQSSQSKRAADDPSDSAVLVNVELREVCEGERVLLEVRSSQNRPNSVPRTVQQVRSTTLPGDYDLVRSQRSSGLA